MRNRNLRTLILILLARQLENWSAFIQRQITKQVPPSTVGDEIRDAVVEEKVEKSTIASSPELDGSPRKPVEESAGSPPEHWFERVRLRVPRHWLERVRARAPQLLKSEKVFLPEQFTEDIVEPQRDTADQDLDVDVSAPETTSALDERRIPDGIVMEVESPSTPTVSEIRDHRVEEASERRGVWVHKEPEPVGDQEGAQVQSLTGLSPVAQHLKPPEEGEGALDRESHESAIPEDVSTTPHITESTSIERTPSPNIVERKVPSQETGYHRSEKPHVDEQALQISSGSEELPQRHPHVDIGDSVFKETVVPDAESGGSPWVFPSVDEHLEDPFSALSFTEARDKFPSTSLESDREEHSTIHKRAMDMQRTPSRDDWPVLPEGETEELENLEALLREQDRLQRLDREQKGT